MTSGHFHSLPLSSITVDRPGRQRRELDNIELLADSIRRLGLIHPIVVNRDNVLVAGERRLEACTRLGWTMISCQYVDELDPLIYRAIELEENIKRSSLPWQDECNAVLEYHNLRLSEDPTWTQDKTGEALGISPQNISDRIAIAQELIAGNARVAEAPKFSTARGIVDRAKARRDEEAMTELIKVSRRPTAVIGSTEPESILNLDFIQWADVYDGPKFNFIHCDFPYGIGADKFKQGSAPTHGGYQDTPDAYWKLLDALARNLQRLTTESTHIMFWFSMYYYQETLDFFASRTDFTIDPFPLIWLKSDNIGILPDPQRGPRRVYETALFGARGDRKVVSAVSNAYAAPTDRAIHMSAKPEPMLRHFFRMFVDNNSLVLDPTCGSGSALRAAESLGATYVLGLEANTEFYERSRLALKSFRATRRLTEEVA